LATSGEHLIGFAECDARFDCRREVAMPVRYPATEASRAQQDVSFGSSAIPVPFRAAALDSDPFADTRRFRQALGGFVGVAGRKCAH
jgi:hypothetical protein